MPTFDYKGITVTVLNNGGRETVSFIDRSAPLAPVTEISGDRIEFPYGSGRFIYEVKGISLDQVSGFNRVKAQSIYLTTHSDGTEEVISKRDITYSVEKAHFDNMSGLTSLPNSTILKTMFMHFVNGLLARVSELGGSDHGWGLEFFNNDGTTTQPLYTYKKESNIIEILPVTSPIAYKLLVDGVEYVKTITTETTDEVSGEVTTSTTTEQTLSVDGLTKGFHSFEYQELDANGVILASQTRNLLV